MKKIFITLLIILFSIPLFAQELSLSKNNKQQQIDNFFNTDTVDKTDTVYIILEYQYNDFDYFTHYNWHFQGYYGFGYYYWYYNDFYWSCTHNWYNDNYHRHYRHHIYKPRPPKPIRQRTIATRVRSDINHKPDRKREYVRPQRPAETRYNRPQSTARVKQVRNTNSRSPRTYNRPTTNRPTSTYTKPSSSQRRYNAPTSSSQRSGTVRSSNSSSNRSSSSGRSKR